MNKGANERVSKITSSDAGDPATMKAQVVACLDQNKATEITVINLQDKATIGEYMVIASGTSARQVTALAEKLAEMMKPQLGGKNIRTDGLRQGDWVLVDLGSVVVHLFRPEVREFYNLEKIWDTPQVSGPDATTASQREYA